MAGEAEHLEVLEQTWRVRKAELLRVHKRKRGYDRQRDRRELERIVRIRALQVTEASNRDRRYLARKLYVSPSTLSTWRRRYRDDKLKARPRGRPIKNLDDRKRRQIDELIKEYGPSVGVPTLQEAFPGVARGELAYRLFLYRFNLYMNEKETMHVLRWTRPGTVWAMDFTKLSLPIDCKYKYIFAVKDLGSGKILLSLPAAGEAAEVAVPALEMLFTAHGPPLVVKSDNGSAFKSGVVRRVFEKWEVKPLFSPTYYPQYNGACEAGIGTLKTYAHYQAVRNDRPDGWTCDDVEAARRRANECSRPFGRAGPSPDMAWSKRKMITTNERSEFITCVETTRRTITPDDADEKNKDEFLRDAIETELVRCGYLSYRRRRVSSPIKTKMVS